MVLEPGGKRFGPGNSDDGFGTFGVGIKVGALFG